MVQIIRVEHKDGIGMFMNISSRKHSLGHQSGLNNLTAKTLWDRHDNFNDPSKDKLDLNKDCLEWFCAYKSINQIQQWIMKDEFDFLFSLGYKVFLLEVDNYQIGQHQIVFTKKSILNKKDISSLFKS